jgi:DNA-binding NarL/FixJ family response regulator
MMWSLFYLAETLLQRSRRGDHEEAERLLERLLEIAVRTGTGLVEDRAHELMQRTEIVPGTAPRSQRPDGLTDREIEVLRLVAAGRTNKEIGRELFISTATVSTHVRNVLEKIGAANRAEASTYAAEHGLTTR